jgi:hypothetical protein
MKKKGERKNKTRGDTLRSQSATKKILSEEEEDIRVENI